MVKKAMNKSKENKTRGWFSKLKYWQIGGVIGLIFVIAFMSLDLYIPFSIKELIYSLFAFPILLLFELPCEIYYKIPETFAITVCFMISGILIGLIIDKYKQNWKKLNRWKIVLIFAFIIILWISLAALFVAQENRFTCRDNTEKYTLIKHRVGSIFITFNGKSVDGITSLCDLSYEEKGHSDDFNNYEFLGYFYSDLFNITKHSYLFKNDMVNYAMIPHFSPGEKIQCSTSNGISSLTIYFFFTEETSDSDIGNIMQTMKSNLEKRWYIGSANIYPRTVALD